MSRRAFWRGIRGTAGLLAAAVAFGSLEFWAAGSAIAVYPFVISCAVSFACLAR